MSDLVRRFESDPASAAPLWRIASHQSARIGDRVYLFKQGSDPRGIFGVGEVIELPRLQRDPTDTDQTLRNRAKIRFDRLVDPRQEFLLGFNVVNEIVPETLITAQSSGNGVPEDVAIELEEHLTLLLPGLPAIGSEDADDAGFDPDSVKDQRERAFRA